MIDWVGCGVWGNVGWVGFGLIFFKERVQRRARGMWENALADEDYSPTVVRTYSGCKHWCAMRTGFEPDRLQFAAHLHMDHVYDR